MQGVNISELQNSVLTSTKQSIRFSIHTPEERENYATVRKLDGLTEQIKLNEINIHVLEKNHQDRK